MTGCVGFMFLDISQAQRTIGKLIKGNAIFPCHVPFKEKANIFDKITQKMNSPAEVSNHLT